MARSAGAARRTNRTDRLLRMLVLALGLGLMPPGASAAQDVAAIVELEAPSVPPGAARAAASALDSARARVLSALPAPARAAARGYDHLPFLAGRFDAASLARLASHPDVRAIHEDRVFVANLLETLPIVGADVLQAGGMDGSGAVVAVLDTGVDAGHFMLQGAVVAEACFSSGRDCPNGRTSQVGAGAAAFCTYADGCFHGTHVAGIAVGRPALRTGVAPGAGLVAVQVFSEGRGATCAGLGEDPCAVSSTSDLIAGLDHVLGLTATFDIAAVNMSLGAGAWTSEATCDAQNAPVKAAVDALVAAGVAVVASSGNGGEANAISAPGCVSSVIAVGASDDADAVWAGSNDASFLDLLAPGRGVVSAVPEPLLGTWYQGRTGTSMAAPHVAGAFALLRGALPGLPPAVLLEAVRATGVPVLDTRSGRTHPRLDVAAAADRLLGPECGNFVDDDGDGAVDFPDDPGCADLLGPETTDCDDDADNDGDGLVDWDGGSGGGAPDPQCTSGSRPYEFASVCGLGFEIVPALGLVALLRRARRRRRG